MVFNLLGLRCWWNIHVKRQVGHWVKGQELSQAGPRVALLCTECRLRPGVGAGHRGHGPEGEEQGLRPGL